jgi:formylglycine-generating enzyme required for sulfatase activity
MRRLHRSAEQYLFVVLTMLAAAPALAQSYSDKRLLSGVVRLSVTPIGGQPDIGAGVVVGVEGSTAYILTALHVVVGPEEVRDRSGWERQPEKIPIQVEFYGESGAMSGKLFEQWDEDKDIAVVVVDSPRIAQRGISVAYGLGSPNTLAPPFAALAIGHGGRSDWGQQTTRVTSVSGPLVKFQANSVSHGYSGGALLDTTRNLFVAMVTAVSDAGGEAVSADLIVTQLNAWRVPHHLRKTRVSSPMVRVAAGRIATTSASQDEAYVDAFFIDQYEVTVGEFRQFVESAGYTYEPGVITCNYGQANRDAYPMNCVSWRDAAAFAKWAGKSLPTEAQWERAARGPAGSPYPWGDTPLRGGDAALRLEWPVPVGSYPRDRSAYGAMDMLGNVSEWVGDWYHRAPATYLSGRNPKGPPSGADRVIRGPSFDTPEGRTDLTLRKRDIPESGRKRFDYGFRCVLNEAVEEKEP